MAPPPTNPRAALRVLVIHPDAAERRRITRGLHEARFDVESQQDIAAGTSLLGALPFDVVLAYAQKTSDLEGIPSTLRGAREGVGVILLVTEDVTPKDNEASLVLPASMDVRDLAQASRLVAHHSRLALRVADIEAHGEHRERLTDVLGAGPAMRAISREIERISAFSTPVLVAGEAGTGHDVVARALHRASPRVHGPFVRVGAASLEGPGLDQELFGARGILFEAHGGTLFIDDIDALPPSTQDALLTYIERGALRPLGEPHEVSVDVRIVAAVSPNADVLRDRPGFRADLALRLGTLVIALPPLRARRDDIPLLAMHLVRAHGKNLGKSHVRSIGVEALRRLRGYDWPGNLRELDGVIERAVARARSDTVVPGDLALGGEEPEGPGRLTLPARLFETPYGKAKEDANERFDRAYVEGALRAAAGNITRAASLAGMDRANFRRLMKRTRGDAD